MINNYSDNSKEKHYGSKVVHRLTKSTATNTIAEAIADLKSTIGEAPICVQIAADDPIDGVVADLNRSSTFIVPNIIEFTDVWTFEAAKDALRKQSKVRLARCPNNKR